jgi:hypothetical protein
LGPTTKIDKLRLFCLISAAILLLTQTLYGSVVLLERHFGPVIPGYLEPLTEIFNQWEWFWYDSEYPIPSIPIPAVTYPAIFCFIYTCCGNITRPPPPAIISIPLCVLIAAGCVFSSFIAAGVI